MALLGLTFKENCGDIRNSKAIDLFYKLCERGLSVQVCDPRANNDVVKRTVGVELIPFDTLKPCQAVIVAVQHDEFVELDVGSLTSICEGKNPIIFDVKSIYDQTTFLDAGIQLMRL